ncbi:MAG: DUF2110 family protein [Candidatus Thorarchaeota archaeon]|jgi:hypothetical protein
MIRLTLLSRAYGPHKKHMVAWLFSRIHTLVNLLNVEITSAGSDNRGYVKLQIEGEDEEFATNLLKQEYGSVLNLNDLTTDMKLQGHLVDVGKVGYGLYVDIGLTTPKNADALIPLYRLRSQFMMSKAPLRNIANSLVLTENLPLEVKLIEIQKESPKIEAELTESFVKRIKSWMIDEHERLILLGVTIDRLETVLSQSGHREDIYRIEKLGLFEYSLCCKRSTRATGILAAIGPRLKGIPMHLFIPREVEAMSRDET